VVQQVQKDDQVQRVHAVLKVHEVQQVQKVHEVQRVHAVLKVHEVQRVRRVHQVLRDAHQHLRRYRLL
jgi:hypothetical protein